MHGLILARGEPSRRDSPLPTPFDEIAGRTLFEHQMTALAPVCDAVTIVLGRGFVDSDYHASDPVSTAADDVDIRVRQRGLRDPPPDVHETRIGAYVGTATPIDVTVVVLPHWDEVGSAEACRQGLRECGDHTLVLEGDVLPRPEVIDRLVAEYRIRLEEAGRSVMGVIPDGDSDVLSVDWNVDGRVTTFGDEADHGVAGVHILHEDHLPELAGLLEQHRTEAFPVFLAAIDTTFLPVPAEGHLRPDETGRSAAESALARWSGRAEKTRPPSG